MDDEKDKDQDNELTAEEKKAEEEALSEVKEEELKSKVAEDFGIDPEDEPELFKKLLEKEQEHRKRLSTAIKQKISWREKVAKASKKDEGTPQDDKGKSQEDKPLTQADIDRLLDEREAKRDLDNLDYSDNIKSEIGDLAKLKNISIKEAAKHPYIVSMIEEAEKEKRIKSATPKRKGKGSYTLNIDPSKALNVEDFKTADGNIDAEAWQKAKEERIKYEREQARAK